MKTRLSLISLLGLMAITMMSCNGGGNNQGQSVDYTHGKSIGLVLTWTIDNSGAEQGTAPFELYFDGDYYVKFYSEYCKLNRIRPIDVGGSVLYYDFVTKNGYHYYLPDISDEDNIFFVNN